MRIRTVLGFVLLAPLVLSAAACGGAEPAATADGPVKVTFAGLKIAQVAPRFLDYRRTVYDAIVHPDQPEPSGGSATRAALAEHSA